MLKRAFDIAVSLAVLAVMSPIMLGAALLIRIRMGSPIVFKQERPGRDTRTFRIYKFRTMLDKHDATGNLLPDEERLTRIGALLRKFSIDELPQLFNVLKGDMSLVGPRPLLVRYLPFYTGVERKRFLVRPGITGLAQISGRNELPWNERLALDVEYVEKWSFRLDMDILVRTFKKVLTRDGFIEVTQSRQNDLDAERKSISY
jgi:sugar transferase EpsL